MADNVTRGTGSEVVSTEEVTNLNGSTVSAQHMQRVVSALRTADGTAVDGVGIAHRLDFVNDSITTYHFGFTPTNITTNTTTTIKTGAGVLAGIKVNNPSAITVASLTMTIYDSTAASGTKIGTFIVPVDTTAKPFSIPFSVAFTTGLTIVTAGPTVAADLTIEWR